MSLNQFKNPLTCFLGSIILMGLIYSVFFGVHEIKEAFTAMLGFISEISWKPIYFLFGSVVLFLQCMIYNNTKGEYKLFLIITLSFVLLFSILCFIANSEAFSWRAVFYSLLLLSISQLVIGLKKTTNDNKDDKSFYMIFIGICTIFLLLTLFTTGDKESSEKKQVAAEIEQQEKIAKEREVSQLKDVEEKYQKKFNKFGFTEIYFTKNMDLYTYHYKMNDFMLKKEGLLVDNRDANKLLDASLVNQINFENIQIKLENDKLTIKGLEYDKKLISQKQLAVSLETVMYNIVMPKLISVKHEIDTQKRNLASHQQ